MPLVSIIMPVYNGQLYLRESIESILNQTFGDFEFIIIDDGSDDNTPKILDTYKDKRIKRLRNDINQGVAKTLNRCLEVAQGEFIARMDADDISLPLRFLRQIMYLNEHPEVGVLGSSAQLIDEAGNFICVLPVPVTNTLISWKFLFNNCLIHTSVVFRRILLKKVGVYSENCKHGEDYDLWVKMSFITKIANLKEVLVCSRKHNNAVSSKFFTEQIQTRTKISKQLISRLFNREICAEEISAMESINKNLKYESPKEIKLAVNLLVKILRKFLSQQKLSWYEREQIYKDMFRKLIYIGYCNKARFPAAALYAYFRAGIILFT